MSKFNKSYRIRTEVGKDTQLHVKLDRNYDILEIMSLKINQENAYKLHTSNYGVIAGRVLANGAFGIPNAKISIFIPIDKVDSNDVIKSAIYPYNGVNTKNKDGVRYNLLPNEQINNCHTIIGTFPEKQFTLDNDTILEIVEKYYKFTTRTNNSGDYMIFGAPVGVQNVHVDIDLSDIGILSQRPRDMVYKGYNINQFENPNKFKYDTNLNSLTQVISQDKTTDVIPFWGDETENSNSIGITRCDIDVEYKFEPTCVFMGSAVSDTSSNGFSRKCIPTPSMGAMDEITTGSGTIEMIRKKPNGEVEEFQIQGTQLINGDGVWCYQIPMNLDYMMTDEFGNMVPTNDPKKGIPTRTRVRFRMSMQDFDNNTTNVFRGKMLVPHNPKNQEEVDYQFGSNTSENSYRDLFWNCVYSVKSYIPRIQKGTNWRSGKFSGFKRVNYYNDNNPIPYNNIRIRIPFMYMIMCTLVKLYFKLVGWQNKFIKFLVRFTNNKRDSSVYTVLDGTICSDDLENAIIIPGVNNKNDTETTWAAGLVARTVIAFIKEIGSVHNIKGASSDDEIMYKSIDSKSIDNKNQPTSDEKYTGVTTPIAWVDGKYIKYKGVTITNDLNYLIQCVEMNLAQEYKVIQFDFYNDWINGLIYIPRWFRNIKKKRTYKWGEGLKITLKIRACNENYKKGNRNIVQQCALNYNENYKITNPNGCQSSTNLRCHKSKKVRLSKSIFSNGGIVNTFTNSKGQYIYYFKPCETSSDKFIKLFSTDIILLGTLNECDKWGIPNNLKEMVSSTYQMPSNLALTDSDIEGDTYSSQGNNSYGWFWKYQGGNLYGKNSSKGDAINKWNQGDTYVGLIKDSENGNYTELAGIDWGYYGPLQMSGATSNDNLYTPGGHFLGLSCRNSQTTLKTCVNLSRICEYGVLMSQRQELSIPQTNGTFKEIAITPSGLISKDEINDSNFRQIFATLNSNKLTTVINPKTGYPIYDFKFIKPTNFSGELNDKIKNNKDYNRVISDNVTEKYYEYIDDDDKRIDKSKTKESFSNEKQIVRTGEYKDIEYIKFRFGIDSFGSLKDINTKFLNVGDDSYSFPIFENSFYFYFGLHDGKTAIDEFKKQYYSVCEKTQDLSITEPALKISNIDVISAGIKQFNGKVEVNIKIDEEQITENNFSYELTSGDSTKTMTDITNTTFTITGLSNSNYVLTVSTKDGFSDSISFKLEEPSFSDFYFIGTDYASDVSNDDIDLKSVKENLNNRGGYIEISEVFSYTNISGETETIQGFTKDYISAITLTGKYEPSSSEETNSTENENACNITVTKKEQQSVIIVYKDANNTPLGDIEVVIDQSNGTFKVPTLNPNVTYGITFILKLNGNGYLDANGKNSHDIEVGTITINNGKDLEVLYNEVPYSVFGVYGDWWENDSFWKGIIEQDLNNNTDYRSLIVSNLYSRDYNTPHTIVIDKTGGIAPYTDYIIDSKDTIESITGVTTNLNSGISNVNNDGFIKYKVIDSLGNTFPEGTNTSFNIPVIYAPFFGELCMFGSKENNEYYLYGNIYNGTTWDKETGFNFCKINGVSTGDFTPKVEYDDWHIITSGVTTLTKYKEGDTELKFKNRKSVYNYPNVNNHIYNLNNKTEINLVVGSEYKDTDKEIDFKDSITIIGKSDFVNWTIITPENGKEDRISIKPDVGNSNEYKVYLLVNETNETKNNYLKRPDLINKNTDIVNLFNHIMSNDLHKYPPFGDESVDVFGDTTSQGGNKIINENGEILLGAKNVPNELYCIALPNTTDKNGVYSVLNSVSISNIINYKDLSSFYPFSYRIAGTHFYNTNTGEHLIQIHINQGGYYTKISSAQGGIIINEDNLGENDKKEIIGDNNSMGTYLGNVITLNRLEGSNITQTHYWWNGSTLNKIADKTFILTLKNGDYSQVFNFETKSTIMCNTSFDITNNSLGINKKYDDTEYYDLKYEFYMKTSSSQSLIFSGDLKMYYNEVIY